MIHDDSWWSGKSSGIFSGGILYNMILISNIFTCNGPSAMAPAPWHRDGDAVSSAPCPSESRNFRAALREGDRILRPWLFTGSRLGSTHQNTMAGINPTRPNPKEFPSTPNRTNTDLIMCHGCQMMATDPNCKPTCFYLFNTKQK